jgi:hypothetical protein
MLPQPRLQPFSTKTTPPPPPKKRKPLTNPHQNARIILPKHTQNGKIAMATTTAKPAIP